MEYLANVLNNLVIIKLSLIFTFLLAVVRLIYSYHKKSRIMQIIVKKLKKLFVISLGFRVIRGLLIFSYKITQRLFLSKRFFYPISVISGLCLGVSLFVRSLLLHGQPLYGQTWLLLLFAVNALFRGIIALGLTLGANKGALWHDLAELREKEKHK